VVMRRRFGKASLALACVSFGRHGRAPNPCPGKSVVQPDAIDEGVLR
jgi:hypothetical protein